MVSATGSKFLSFRLACARCLGIRNLSGRIPDAPCLPTVGALSTGMTLKIKFKIIDALRSLPQGIHVEIIKSNMRTVNMSREMYFELLAKIRPQRQDYHVEWNRGTAGLGVV